MAALVPIGAIVMSWALTLIKQRPQNPNPIKNDTYECGMQTIGQTWVQFKFRYYVVALLFVIFDVETVFLYPWAVAFRQVKLFGFVEAVIFILILLVGFAYAWRKKALQWE